MITIRIVFLLIVYCSLVYGDCKFHGDPHTKYLEENMKKWGVYQNFTVSRDGLIYLVGICVSPDNTNTAIIQQDKETNRSIVLGKLDDVNLIGEDNWILLTFENGDKYDSVCDNLTRAASIMLLCGPNKNNLTILQEHTDKDQHCNYMFKLQVPQMCPPTEEKSKLSGGAIFLIILFGLTTIYCVFGAIFMHVRRGARGLDRIPNLEMWHKLGNFAADGCDFCCRCERTSSRAGYFLEESGRDMHSGDDDILNP